MGSGNMVNTMLNYGYALLEAECLRAINTIGLDPHVGFLHEMNPDKNSLAYDLQEPFRFLVDLVVMSLVENEMMDKKDFIVTENYNLRLRGLGAKKIAKRVLFYDEPGCKFWRKTNNLGFYPATKNQRVSPLPCRKIQGIGLC